MSTETDEVFMGSKSLILPSLAFFIIAVLVISGGVAVIRYFDNQALAFDARSEFLAASGAAYDAVNRAYFASFDGSLVYKMAELEAKRAEDEMQRAAKFPVEQNIALTISNYRRAISLATGVRPYLNAAKMKPYEESAIKASRDVVR